MHLLDATNIVLNAFLVVVVIVVAAYALGQMFRFRVVGGGIHGVPVCV